MMSNYDLQRIENAIWTLWRYRNELSDTNADTIIDGVSVSTDDALRILDIALYKMEKENKQNEE